VLLIDNPAIGTRDFADGEATALQTQLVEAGAELCPGDPATLAEVENLP
jgi:hypothetical protein